MPKRRKFGGLKIAPQKMKIRMRTLVMCLMVGMFLAIFLIFNAPATLVVLFGSLLAISFILTISRPEDYKFLFKVFVTGITCRLLIALLFYILSLAKGGDGFLIMDDGIDASYNALEIVKIWQNGIIPDEAILKSACPSTRIGPYHFWNAFIYYFTGWNPLAMFFINCFVGALSVVLVYMIAKEIFNKKVGMVSSAIYLFWPSTFLWSTMNSKEPLTIFFVFLAMWFFINLKRKFSMKYLISTTLSVLFLTKLRGVVSVSLFFAILLSFIFQRRIDKKNLNISIMRFIAIAIITIFVSVALIDFQLFVSSGKLFGLSLPGNNIFEVIDYAHNVRTLDASSAFFAGVDISTPLRTVVFLPFGLFFVFFAPFPSQITSRLQLIAAPEMAIWYMFLPFIFYGILLAAKYRWRDSSVMILFILSMCLILALCEGNVGTMFRHRAFIIPFCLIFAIAGLVKFNKEIRYQPE